MIYEPFSGPELLQANGTISSATHIQSPYVANAMVFEQMKAKLLISISLEFTQMANVVEPSMDTTISMFTTLWEIGESCFAKLGNQLSTLKR